MEYLKTFPRMAPAMIGAYKGCRCLLAVSGKYRIIYKIKSEQLIEVAYIRHSARQLGLRVIPQDEDEILS